MGFRFINKRGSWDRTEKALQSYAKDSYADSVLHKYGRIGIDILRQYTPKRTGLTSASWSYKVNSTSTGYSLEFYNSNLNRGVNIAVILQYGHGTRNGGYVTGIDYLNPAAAEIFEMFAESLWTEVKNT